MVQGKAKAKKLCASGLWFGGAVKIIKRYWNVGPDSVCMTCCGIRYQRRGSCGDEPQKCIICAGLQKIKDHQCGVAECQKGKKKICVHVTPKYANCMGTHATNSPRYISRHKAEINAREKKRLRKFRKKKNWQVI